MLRRVPTTVLSAAAFVFLSNAERVDAQPVVATGPEAEVTADGLHRVDPAIMGSAWVRPDLDLSHYRRIYFLPTAVQFRDVRPVRSVRAMESAEEFQVNPSLAARLRELFGESFHETVSEGRLYELTDELGRDVLMVRGLLTDVISGVPPDLPGSVVSTIRWLWEAGIVLELRDSMSDEVLARTADRRRVDGPMDASLAGALTPRVVDTWCRLLMVRLEELSELGGHPELSSEPADVR